LEITNAKIGIIGLGLMGSEIVHRLIDCGFRVHLYNRSTTKLTGLIEKGAMREISPKNLADKCDFVLLCVTDGEAVKQVCFGDNGIAMSNNSDLIVVDLSTILPDDAIYCALKLKRKHITYIQMPVMGGPDLAREGSLVGIASGNLSAYNKFRNIAEVITDNVVHVSKSDGTANYIKLGLNLNIAQMAVALSESIVFIKKAGIDPRLFLEIFNRTRFSTGLSQIKGPRMLVNNFEPKFFLKNMLKDIQLLNESARSMNVSLPFSGLADDIYCAALNRGYGDLDYTSIIALLYDLNSVEN
jgi:3-hydroxyisobutyrate dehydrogenase